MSYGNWTFWDLNSTWGTLDFCGSGGLGCDGHEHKQPFSFAPGEGLAEPSLARRWSVFVPVQRRSALRLCGEHS